MKFKFIAAGLFAAVMRLSAYADGHKKDIVDTAVEAGSFGTLVSAL